MQVDILSPFTQLEWRECSELPVGMNHAQAVWLGGKLYVGGGGTSGNKSDNARLYVYTLSTDAWTCGIYTPVYWFSPIIYHSQLVLVGGEEYFDEFSDGFVTNKLWTLTADDQWIEILPPMMTKRHSVSAVEFTNNIFVAGGVDDDESNLNIVEIYDGHHWSKAQCCLPKPCFWAIILNRTWCVVGGVGQGKELYIYYASLDSLVDRCGPSQKSVWRRLPGFPDKHSCIGVIGNRLVAVGGVFISCRSSIYAYSPYSRSWIHVGNIPFSLHSTCTTVLPTGELMVIGGSNSTSIWGSNVYKSSINGKYLYQY